MEMVTIVMLGETINAAIVSALILQVVPIVMLYSAGLIMVGRMLNTAVQDMDDQHVAIGFKVTLYKEMLQLSIIIHIHPM